MTIAIKVLVVYNCLLLIHTGLLVRLVGGSSYYEGRVEVNYGGEWGTVCDDGWSYADAYVVCRQLGFGTYRTATAYGNAYFGQGSGPILLDSVTCTGSELILANCSHLGIGITRSCSHREDAGVRCYQQGTANIALYLLSQIAISSKNLTTNTLPNPYVDMSQNQISVHVQS